VGDRPRQALGTRLERGAHPELPQPELRRHHRRVKDEDYDEKRADNKVGAKNARVDAKIDARSADAGSETSKSKKKMNCKKFFLAVLCSNYMYLAARNTNWSQFMVLYMLWKSLPI
jgi:hypothetical protein